MKNSALFVIFAAFLVLFQFFFLLARPFPILMDDWYHISVIRAFYERRSVQFWDDWEFAPYGRPHLYPPLFHAAGAVLVVLINSVFGLGTQGSILRAFLLLKALSYPLLLFSVWWLSRKLFSEKAAFYSLLLAMGVFALFLAAEAIVPSAFALALLNFLAFFFLKKRTLASILLLAAIAYTHLGVFALAQLLLLIFSLFYRKEYLRQFVVVEAVSFFIYSPWLLHVLLNFAWFVDVKRSLGFTIPILVWLPALAGVRIAIKEQKRRHVMLLAYAAALLPMLLSYGHRFWIYAVLPLSILGGEALARVQGRQEKAVVWAVLAASLFYAPTLYDNESFTGYFSPTTIGGFLVESPLSIEITKLRILDSPLSREETEMAAWVGSNTGKSEIIMAGKSGFSNMVHAMTGRRASGGIWHETAPSWLLEKSAKYDASANGTLICEPPCPRDADFMTKIGRFEVRKR